MTAVAAPYDDLFAGDDELTEADIESLDEHALVVLLTSRYRRYAAGGLGSAEALLRAVGFPAGEAEYAAHALTGSASVLH
jgi:hypothetical protein